MEDLLMAQSSVSLPDGENGEIDLTLQRKVLEISSVVIRQVPTDVSGVEVSLSPLYSSVLLNGDYADGIPATCAVTLADAGSGVWQTTSQRLCFPSSGDLTITVSFTREDSSATQSFTYSFDDALETNHLYNLEGTYTEPLGVTLSGRIIAQPWNTEATDISFEFNNDNTETPSTTTIPKAGQIYNGYYVVSVDVTNRTAVLLAETQKDKISSEELLNDALAGYPKPEGITNNWRIPTFTELKIFMEDSNTPDRVFNVSYYCMDGDTRSRATVEKNSGGTIAFKNPIAVTTTELAYLRPVIDINY